MIGVGYYANGKWIYRDFTVNVLNKHEERRICFEFTQFVTSTAAAYGVKFPKCYHWGAAEPSCWEAMYEHNDDIVEIFFGAISSKCSS